MAVTTHAMIPVNPIVPDNQPSQNARRLGMRSRVSWSGINAIQARSPRSNFGKHNGNSSPLAQARSIWRARARSIATYHNDRALEFQGNSRRIVDLRVLFPFKAGILRFTWSDVNTGGCRRR